ncbi:putative hydrolase [Cyphellophora attinorum]|uniref:Putative hydrolase n=1 Tax=Cyphellophora attinorum TaxID=1664694 RepID=A0A0N0NIQ3_9EURO|nr:putative hydrolase [Phialophora attinorum]KPI35719.1 putative hydrolase [Phialophora attinorum]
MAKLPTAADFPVELSPILHEPSTGKPVNIILFLAGLGDSSANFSSFARALNLPDTIAVTLQGPYPLPFPFGPGNQWSDDVQVDTFTGTFDADSPLGRSTAQITEAVQKLIADHGFAASQILLFGNRQGGSVALAVALALQKVSLGGVVSVGGSLPSSAALAPSLKNKTPLLLLGGRKGTLAKDDGSPVKRIKAAFEFVESHQWKRADDGLPRNREEALPMMQFLARRLKSRRGVPEEAVEI